jgi:hypothetical protein
MLAVIVVSRRALATSGACVSTRSIHQLSTWQPQPQQRRALCKDASCGHSQPGHAGSGLEETNSERALRIYQQNPTATTIFGKIIAKVWTVWPTAWPCMDSTWACQ